MSLATRLIILILLAAVPVLTLQIYDQFQDRSSEQRAIGADAQRLASLEAERFGHVVEVARGLLGVAATLPEFRADDGADNGDACKAQARRILERFPEFVGLGAIAVDGYTFCRSAGGRRVFVGDRRYFQEVLNERRFSASGYTIGRAKQRPVMIFAAPAIDEAGRVSAMVTTAYPLDNFAKTLSEAILPAGASLSLIDPAARIRIARFPLLAGSADRTPMTAQFDAAFGSRGHGTFAASGADGVERVYGFASMVDPATLRVVVGLPLVPAIEGIDSKFWLNLLVIAGTFAAAACFALFLGQVSIRRPIRHLKRVAWSLAAGDLSARTSLARGSPREVVALAQSFDEMAGAIADRERTLAASEAFSRRILESSRDCIKVLDLDGRVRFINVYGQDTLESRGDDFNGRVYADLWPEESRQAARTAIDEAIAGGTGRFQGHLRTGSGRDSWWDVAITPITAADGRTERLLVIARDMTELRQAEEQREFLMAELDHRVKNVLASVQSIASRTLGDGDQVQRFRQRLGAMAKTHSLLSRSRWQGAGLRELLGATLEAYGRQIDLTGPDLRLDPKTTQSLGMILHELATNAAKYGALSLPTGRVVLTWQAEANGMRSLALDWQEMGGPPAVAPAAKGFGLAFLELSVTHELGGRLDCAFTPAGLHCVIRIPLKSGAPSAEALADAQPQAENPSPAGDGDIAGKRILIVEDELLVALHTQSVLEAAGAVVIGPAATLEAATRLAGRGEIDAAILDVNLNGELVFPLAKNLAERAVPVVFLTGYINRAIFPNDMAAMPRVGKPFEDAALLSALAGAMAASGAPVGVSMEAT